jgi:phosphate transport system substrate-binding protein
MVAAACGDDDDAETTTTAAATTTAETTEATEAPSGGLSGSIAISGSSTVEPISARNAEKFVAANPDVAISVQGPGTGDGAQIFCAGDIDIGDASRPYKEEELATCAENGIEFVELNVATDGLSVLTSLENDNFDCLGTADLYALLGPESTGFGTWADANDLAAEVGAPNAPYPDEDLVITAPGEESGTFDTFVEFLIDGVAGGEDYAETREAESVRPDYVASANDNVIIEGIAGAPGSLGWVGYAFFLANQDRVKALAIDATNDGTCVVPTPETIADGSYPFSRPLFIYVNLESAMRPEVAAYVDFYLSEEGLASIDETGYIRLADYADVLAAWQNA